MYVDYNIVYLLYNIIVVYIYYYNIHFAIGIIINWKFNYVLQSIYVNLYLDFRIFYNIKQQWTNIILFEMHVK